MTKLGKIFTGSGLIAADSAAADLADNSTALGGVAASGYVNTASTQTVTGAKTFSGKVTTSLELIIPTVAPSSPANGNIWIA